MAHNRLTTLLNQRPLTPRAARRLMDTSRSEAHQPASSKPQRIVRPIETIILDDEAREILEKAGKKTKKQ